MSVETPAARLPLSSISSGNPFDYSPGAPFAADSLLRHADVGLRAWECRLPAGMLAEPQALRVGTYLDMPSGAELARITAGFTESAGRPAGGVSPASYALDLVLHANGEVANRRAALAGELDDPALLCLLRLLLTEENPLAVISREEFYARARDRARPGDRAYPAWREYTGRLERRRLEAETARAAYVETVAKSVRGQFPKQKPTIRALLGGMAGRPGGCPLLEEILTHFHALDYVAMWLSEEGRQAGARERWPAEQYVRGFKRGVLPPEPLRAAIHQNLTSLWKPRKPLPDRITVARYIVAFSYFWRRYGNAFTLRVQPPRRAPRETEPSPPPPPPTPAAKPAPVRGKNPDRVKGGRERARARETARYRSFAEAFRQFAAPSPGTHPGWADKGPDVDLIRLFPKQKGVALEKGRDLLGTLWTGYCHAGSRSCLEQTLRARGIPLSQEAAGELMEIIFTGKKTSLT